MNYQTWLTTIPKEFTEHTLWKMEIYRLALFIGDLAWPDATKLMQDRRTLGLSDQLYRAVGSISTNYSTETIELDELLTNVSLPPAAT